MSPLCGVRAIYILAMCISSSVFDFPLTSNVGDRSLNPKCTYLGCLSPVHCGAGGRWHSMLTRRLSLWWYLYHVRVSIGVWGALVWGVLGRSWGGFAHVATVTLSWRVIFRCDRLGTCWAGARQILVGFRVWSAYRWWDRRQSCEICTCTLILMTKISFHLFVFVLNLCCSLVQLCHVMLAINCTELNWIELKRLRKQPSKQMLCKFSGKN